jgi:DNA-binding NtrC family response regulator
MSKPQKNPVVLLVEDEAGSRFGMKDYLENHSFVVKESPNLHGGYYAFRDSPPDAAVIDYRLPDGNALDALPKLRQIDPNVPIIVLTGHGSIDLAVDAMRQGADYFLTKPIDLEKLAKTIDEAIQDRRNHHRRATDSKPEIGAPDPFLGFSPSIQRLRVHTARLKEFSRTGCIAMVRARDVRLSN